MASVGEGDCHKDPNFAVICSFFDKYGALLELPEVTYTDLQKYLEDSTNDVSKVLIDIHLKLLRRIRKAAASSERFEKNIIKFIHSYSEFDAWEVESYGYKHTKLDTKLRILKNLMECQFDCNIKFKEKVNESNAADMRFLPIGRDKNGQAYWYFLDKDMNLLVYKEEQDDEEADTWQLVCSDRQDLANLVSILQNDTLQNPKEEDKISTSGSRSSKEASPEKDVMKLVEIDKILGNEETKVLTDCVSKEVGNCFNGAIKTEKLDFKSDIPAKIENESTENESLETATVDLSDNKVSVNHEVSPIPLTAKSTVDSNQDNSAEKFRNGSIIAQDTAVAVDKADASQVNDDIQDKSPHKISQIEQIECKVINNEEQLIKTLSKEKQLLCKENLDVSEKSNEGKNNLDIELLEKKKLLNNSDELMSEQTAKDLKPGIGLEDSKLKTVINSQKAASFTQHKSSPVGSITPNAELELLGIKDLLIASTSPKDPPDKIGEINDSCDGHKCIPLKVTDADKSTERNPAEFECTENVIKKPEETNEQKTNELSKEEHTNLMNVIELADHQVIDKKNDFDPKISGESLEAVKDLVTQKTTNVPQIVQKSLNDQETSGIITGVVTDRKISNVLVKTEEELSVKVQEDLKITDEPSRAKNNSEISGMAAKTREDSIISDEPSEAGRNLEILESLTNTREILKVIDEPLRVRDHSEISDVPAKTGEDSKISDETSRAGENVEILEIPGKTREIHKITDEPLKITDKSPITRDNSEISDLPAKRREDPITDEPLRTQENTEISDSVLKTGEDRIISDEATSAADNLDLLEKTRVIHKIPDELSRVVENSEISDVPSNTADVKILDKPTKIGDIPEIRDVPATKEAGDLEISDVPAKTKDPEILDMSSHKKGDAEISDVPEKTGKDQSPLENPVVAVIDQLHASPTETEIQSSETAKDTETSDALIDKDLKKLKVSLSEASKTTKIAQESSTFQCALNPNEKNQHSKVESEVSQNKIEISASNNASDIIIVKESSHLNVIEQHSKSAALNITNLQANDSLKEEIISGSPSSLHMLNKNNDKSESQHEVDHPSVTPDDANSCSNTVTIRSENLMSANKIIDMTQDINEEKSCLIGNTEGSVSVTEAMSAMGVNGAEKLGEEDHHNKDTLKTKVIENELRNDEKQKDEITSPQGEINEPQGVKSNESQRNLKRAAPEPGSDEPIDSEPNGKRAKQAVKAQKTRGGRNAAARGRAARLGQGESETDDSETPLSQVRSRRQARTRKLQENLRDAKDQAKTEKENNEDSVGDPTVEKRAKKKKPGSTSEMISEEEVTPAKKGRNHSQSTKPIKSASVKRGKGGNKGSKTILSSNEDDAAGVRRSLRVRQLRARRPPTPSSPSEESEEDEEEEDDEETENEDPHFLDASFTPEEESGDEEFKPTGRNYRRQAARTSQENVEEVVNDDTPCVKCGKYNHPEMILLCDKCDAGYHTACLRPPLMLIPDGDWFCPPCEHIMLVAKLLDCLQTLDNAKKKKDRLNKRQERLAFVGINISNILHGDQKTPGAGTRVKKFRNEKTADENEGNENNETGSSSFDSEEEEPERVYRSERLALRQAQKRSRHVKHKVRKSRAYSPEVEVLTKRTCRVRNNVSYQFKEFDDLISNAIEDDKPCRREKPPGIKRISRGKDMSNILGASDEEDEKIRQRDGESGPPPVVKKRSKRKLTKLDSDEDPDDDSEEFKISDEDDTDVSEAEEEEEEEEDEGLKSSDSGGWKSKKTWSNSHASTIRPTRRAKNFVVDDEDYDSDENTNKRRSTRNSNRGRIHYNDWESDETEEEEVSFSDYSSDEIVAKAKRQRKKKPVAAPKRKVKSKGKKEEESNDSQSDSSLAQRRKILRKLVKKRRKDDSESQDSDAKIATEKKKTSVKNVKKTSDSDGSELTLEEDSRDDYDESPKFKKKNVLRSSDEEEHNEKVNHESSGVEVKPNADKPEADKPEAVTPEADKPEVVKPEADEPEVVKLEVVKTEVISQREEEKQTETKVKPATGKKGKAVKGKKRVETEVDESRVVPPATVPGKVRKVSGGSDKELCEKSEQVMSTAVSVDKNKIVNRRQRGKNKEVIEESSCLRQGKKILPENFDKLMDSARVVIEKLPNVGKKKKVPNFLDVPSGGEDSDEPDKKQPVASTVSQEAPAPKGQIIPTTLGHQAQVEAHSQYRNFPYPSALPPQHNMHYAPRPAHYQYSGQSMPPFPQGPTAGAPPHHAGQTGGPPLHASQPQQSMTSPPAQSKTMGEHSHCIPTSPNYQGPMPHHPTMGALHQMRQVHPGYNGGSGSNSASHHYQSSIGQGHQNLEPGQIPSNVNQHMAHTGFPMSNNGQMPAHITGHGGAGMVQQNTVGMKPGFHVGQQNNDVNYQPSYGPGRMPSSRDLRHPYYAMQAAQHYSAHYPPGAAHNISSPLSSMGQMAKNLGQGSNLQSVPPVAATEGTRHQAMVSPPHQDIKQENEDIKSEGSEGDYSKKSMGKEGKKRGAQSKGKSKSKDISQQQSPMTGSKVSKMSKDHDGPLELNERASMKGRPGVPSQELGSPSQMGSFRPPADSPYNTASMPSYQMPYVHQSIPHMPAKPYIAAPSAHGPSLPSNQAKVGSSKPELDSDGVANTPENQVPPKQAISPNEQRPNMAYQSKGQSVNEPQCNSGQPSQAHESPLPYSHRPGLSAHLQGSNQAHGPYYPGPYYQPYGGQSMPSHNSWPQNVSPYGPRMGSHIYQYGMNSETSHTTRMPTGILPHSKHGLHEPPQAANPNTVVQKTASELINSQVLDSVGKPGPEKRTLSTDSQPEVSDQCPRDNNQVLDGSPPKNAEKKLVKEVACKEDVEQSAPPPSSAAVPLSTLSSTSSTQITDKQTISSSFKTSPDSVVKHQTSPTVNMPQQNTWPDANVNMHYHQQMGGPWPHMNDPGQYGMMRPYGPPGMMGNPHYPGVNKSRFEHQPPHNKMQIAQNPSHMKDRMMGSGHFLSSGYSGYDPSFQPPHSRPMGPGSDFHGMAPRPGFNSEQTCPPSSFRPHSNDSNDSNSHRHEVSPTGNQARDDSLAETSAAPKPKRPKTNKKSKDSAMAGRIRAGKGRGRGRGGFMIDNLLQARSVEGDEEGEDSGEMKDIVSYVTTDDYFKQQTSS